MDSQTYGHPGKIFLIGCNITKRWQIRSVAQGEYQKRAGDKNEGISRYNNMTTTKDEKVIKRQMKVLLTTVDRYVSFISRSCKLEGNNYESSGGIRHYGFIPSDTKRILDTLSRLYFHMDSQGHKFLDIGCGIGNVVLLANLVGFDACGLEYNEEIYNVGKDLIGRDRILRGDMNAFTEYDKYDVLYYYEPICEIKAMLEFAAKLAEMMKRGAYVIPNGVARPFRKSNKFKEVILSEYHHTIFKKK